MQVPVSTPVQSRTLFKNQPSVGITSVEQALSLPGKYEVTPEQVFTITLLVKEYKGRWVIAEKEGRGVDVHKVIFRIWTYEEMVDLRKRATSYDPLKRSSVVDYDLLNRLKIQKLLQSWTFDKDNPRLGIQHVNGILTDESWKAFTKLSPFIADKIINEMNMVLDYGG